jgi:hypothetical protein
LYIVVSEWNNLSTCAPLHETHAPKFARHLASHIAQKQSKAGKPRETIAREL